jgi:hypothetical protein
MSNVEKSLQNRVNFYVLYIAVIDAEITSLGYNDENQI